MGTGGKAETESPVCDWAGRGLSEPCLWVGAGFQVSKTMTAEQVTAEDACSSRVPFPLVPAHLLRAPPEHLLSRDASDARHHCTQHTACDCVCGVSAIGQNH